VTRASAVAACVWGNSRQAWCAPSSCGAAEGAATGVVVTAPTTACPPASTVTRSTRTVWRPPPPRSRSRAAS